MKLRDAIEHYVAWRQAHGVKFLTARNLLRQFLQHADGDAGCDAVTCAQVQAFLAGTGPVTRHRENKHYALAGFWRYAISRGHALSSPLPESERRPPLQAPPHIYSRDQLQRLFDPDHIDNALQGSRQLDPATFRTLLLMLYGAGLRFGEATALTCLMWIRRRRSSRSAIRRSKRAGWFPWVRSLQAYWMPTSRFGPSRGSRRVPRRSCSPTGMARGSPAAPFRPPSIA